MSPGLAWEKLHVLPFSPCNYLWRDSMRQDGHHPRSLFRAFRNGTRKPRFTPGQLLLAASIGSLPVLCRQQANKSDRSDLINQAGGFFGRNLFWGHAPGNRAFHTNKFLFISAPEQPLRALQCKWPSPTTSIQLEKQPIQCKT